MPGKRFPGAPPVLRYLHSRRSVWRRLDCQFLKVSTTQLHYLQGDCLMRRKRHRDSCWPVPLGRTSTCQLSHSELASYPPPRIIALTKQIFTRTSNEEIIVKQAGRKEMCAKKMILPVPMSPYLWFLTNGTICRLDIGSLVTYHRAMDSPLGATKNRRRVTSPCTTLTIQGRFLPSLFASIRFRDVVPSRRFPGLAVPASQAS